MQRLAHSFVIAAMATALACGVALAQQSSPSDKPPAPPIATTEPPAAKKTEPSAWDQTKAMTRKEWDAAKRKWAMEKVKWRDCNRQARAEKLTAPKSWSFIASCMTKS